MNNEKNYLPTYRTKEEIEEMRKNRKMTDGGAGEELFKELVNALNEKQPADNDELEWEIPVPFNTYNLPKFDSQVFSPTIKDMVESVAKFTQTPVDLPAIIAFGVLSTVLSKKFFVEPKKGWKEPLNTYTTVLMESSNRKSAAYNAMTEPIYLYEKDLINEMKPKIQKRFAERGAIKKRIEKLQNDYAKTSDPAIKEEIKDVVDELEALPELYVPALLLDNSTEEKIVTRLKENNEKIAIMSSEGDLFERIKLKGNESEKLDVYLKGYSGDPLRVDRVTRDTERLEEPLMTICISAQPTVIQSMPRKLNDRGLIPRFLFSIPDDFVGYRDVL
ncbi:YfjI family protein, partial [Caldibacillus thermoamylovorans]|nr:YfjI family protein [Caldibacillus thermoamylovorans]